MKMTVFTTILSVITAMSLTAGESVYEFTVKDIKGEDVNLKEHEGNVLLIVNVASQCGVTGQYEIFQALHEALEDRDFVVLGFPANNFGGQEPGTNSEILKFCTSTYQVTFPMFAKVSVTGDDTAELFKHLTAAENPDFTGPIQWNFEKILVGKDGKVARRFRSNVEPDSPEFLDAIKAELEK
ncbi:MAG: glutathione peroxidase [Verrucomicrobiales bacterium]|jgi:glutathione peroxidase